MVKNKMMADDKTDIDASGMRHFIYRPLIIVLLLALLLVVIGLAAYQFVPHYVPIQKLQNFWAAPSPIKPPNITVAAIPDIKPDIKIDATNVPVAVPPPIQIPTLTLKAANRASPAGRPAGRPDLAADTRLLLQAENGQNYAQALQQAMQQELIDDATHAALAPYATQGVPSLKQVNRLYQQFRAQYKQAISPAISSAIITNPITTDDDMPPDAPRFIMWLSRLGGGHIRITRLPTTAKTTPPASTLPTIEQLDALILAGDLHQAAPLAETLLTDATQDAPMQNATIKAQLIDWHDALKIYLLTQPILADLRTKILQGQQP